MTMATRRRKTTRRRQARDSDRSSRSLENELDRKESTLDALQAAVPNLPNICELPLADYYDKLHVRNILQQQWLDALAHCRAEMKLCSTQLTAVSASIPGDIRDEVLTLVSDPSKICQDDTHNVRGRRRDYQAQLRREQVERYSLWSDSLLREIHLSRFGIFRDGPDSIQCLVPKWLQGRAENVRALLQRLGRESLDDTWEAGLVLLPLELESHAGWVSLT